ncbi:MAG: 4'-phosphopantetheinyl transferase superfamily protein [Tannerellaceae bacterium]|jgi:phosphopantetheinyl transferase|nr:4'-phosphopantetheinyl transferase superfamily protein [Tannerellaceae bacterium]
MPLFLRDTEPLRGVWKIEESPDELLSRLDRRDDYLPSLARMQTDKRKQEWLAARVLLKELLGEELPVAYRPDGAPYLPESPLHISISHTRAYAAVAVNEAAPTGVDIEYLSDRILKVRSRFMNPEEEEMIDPAQEAEHLLLCWCAKETLFKLIGRRDVDFQRHLHLLPFPCGESGSLIARETRTPQAATYRLHYLRNRYFAMMWFRDTILVS